MHIKNFDPYDFSKKEIDGVPVYYKNLPWAPCIHISIDFNVGAFNDPVGKEGVAHFLEHMIFNGSPLFPDKKSIDKFGRIYMLNSHNASTGFYRTSHSGKCLPENMEKVLEAMRDYVFNPFLKDEDVEHERKVITQEAWGRYKNEKYLKYVREFGSNMYSGNEHGRILRPLGFPETVAKISRKDIFDFHKKNYVKENLSVLLVGEVDKKDIDLMNDFVSGLPSGKSSAVAFGKIEKPKQQVFERNSDDIGDPQEQLEFSLGRVAGKISIEDSEIGNQMRSLLQDILFERLRLENSLCYKISVYAYRYRDFSEVGISVNAKDENLSLIEKEIKNVIKEILEDKWANRFDEIHKVNIDQIKSNERSSWNIIDGSSNDIVVDGKITCLENTIENAEKVTYEKIKKMVKETFDPEWTITEIIHPTKK